MISVPQGPLKSENSGNTHVRFRRAIELRALCVAEDAACELLNLPLEDAFQLVRLYAEKESPKYEKAALRWFERYLAEGFAPAKALRGGRCESRQAAIAAKSARAQAGSDGSRFANGARRACSQTATSFLCPCRVLSDR